jgi:hypothetical protein
LQPGVFGGERIGDVPQSGVAEEESPGRTEEVEEIEQDREEERDSEDGEGLKFRSASELSQDESEAEIEERDQNEMDGGADGCFTACAEKFREDDESGEEEAHEEHQGDESRETDSLEFEENGAPGKPVVEGLGDGKSGECDEMADSGFEGNSIGRILLWGSGKSRGHRRRLRLRGNREGRFRRHCD